MASIPANMLISLELFIFRTNEYETSLFSEAFIGMRPEKISLCLNEIGRHIFNCQAIKIT